MLPIAGYLRPLQTHVYTQLSTMDARALGRIRRHRLRRWGPLEQFGDLILDRPDPAAVWSRRRAPMHGTKPMRFNHGRTKGNWVPLDSVPKDGTSITSHHGYSCASMEMTLQARRYFPEQAANWNCIAVSLASNKFLNLFAYTGGASIAARSVGAEVTWMPSAKW